MAEMKNLALVGGGVVLGALGGKMVDKVLKVDDTLPGFSMKKLAKPAVQLGVGIIGAWKLKDPNMKLIAAGVGATGVVSAANMVMNKNLLAGIPGLGNTSQMGIASVYDEPVQLSIGRYNPDLPQLYPAGNSMNSYGNQVYGAVEPAQVVVESEFEII